MKDKIIPLNAKKNFIIDNISYRLSIDTWYSNTNTLFAPRLDIYTINNLVLGAIAIIPDKFSYTTISFHYPQGNKLFDNLHDSIIDCEREIKKTIPAKVKKEFEEMIILYRLNNFKKIKDLKI